MKKLISAFLAASCCFLPSSVSMAQINLDGYFIAREACEAVQSIRKKTNPVELEKDHAYTLFAKNKESATHYLIDADGNRTRRWVPVTCGEHVVPADGPLSGAGSVANDNQSPQGSSSAERYVLAMSWQPAFCETRPSKPECVSQTDDRFDASHFALHGLWPQPRSNIYCNVSAIEVALDKDRKWDELPALVLEEETRQELNRVMPGTQSNLHRHEWIKHGTCYNGEPAEDYYADSLKLMDAVNTSSVQAFFAANIGKEVSMSAIRDEFDAAFGAGAGERVKASCKKDNNSGRNMIVELTLGLAGDLQELSVSDAIFAAPTTSAGCPGGIIDPAGFQ